MDTNAFLVYGKRNCPWCTKAKQLLDKLQMFYVYMDVAEDTDLRERLKAAGHKTVPVVFLGDELIGGYNELTEWVQKNG